MKILIVYALNYLRMALRSCKDAEMVARLSAIIDELDAIERA